MVGYDVPYQVINSAKMSLSNTKFNDIIIVAQ